MANLFETYRGAVRREELDEMGHMNVAFYLKKSSDALTNVRFLLGLNNKSLAQKGLAVMPARDRIFFNREVHLGDALKIETGIRGTDERGGIKVVNLLENLENGTTAAQFETSLHLIDKSSGDQVPWPEKTLSIVQEYQGSYPQAPEPEPFEDVSISIASPEKRITTYQGHFDEIDSDQSGFGAPHAHIARFWTAFPNIMKEIGVDHEKMVAGGIGSAALDYRLTYHRPVRPGTAVEIQSCLLEMGEKVFRFAHFMQEKAMGTPITTVDVLGVLFDLKARKAIPFPEEYRKGGALLLVDRS